MYNTLVDLALECKFYEGKSNTSMFTDVECSAH